MTQKPAAPSFPPRFVFRKDEDGNHEAEGSERFCLWFEYLERGVDVPMMSVAEAESMVREARAKAFEEAHKKWLNSNCDDNQLNQWFIKKKKVKEARASSERRNG